MFRDFPSSNQEPSGLDLFDDLEDLPFGGDFPERHRSLQSTASDSALGRDLPSSRSVEQRANSECEPLLDSPPFDDQSTLSPTWTAAHCVSFLMDAPITMSLQDTLLSLLRLETDNTPFAVEGAMFHAADDDTTSYELSQQHGNLNPQGYSRKRAFCCVDHNHSNHPAPAHSTELYSAAAPGELLGQHDLSQLELARTCGQTGVANTYEQHGGAVGAVKKRKRRRLAFCPWPSPPPTKTTIQQSTHAALTALCDEWIPLAGDADTVHSWTSARSSKPWNNFTMQNCLRRLFGYAELPERLPRTLRNKCPRKSELARSAARARNNL